MAKDDAESAEKGDELKSEESRMEEPNAEEREQDMSDPPSKKSQ